MAPILVSHTDAVFVVIDVQNDFCPGGALAVPDGDGIVPIVNGLSAAFTHVVATQDWHPSGHNSFASRHAGHAPFDTIQLDYGEQVLWPDHCVQGTPGADFHPRLDITRYELIIRKGYNVDIDSYSAFFENDHRTTTGLGGYLTERGLKQVFLAGLAGDVCVMYSALDAARLGFDTYVITDAYRAIGSPVEMSKCEHRMRDAGIHLVTSASILP